MTTSPTASGTAKASSHRRSRSFARSSGERGWRNARAVAVTRAARLSAPTAVASYSAAPSTANEPDQTGSPRCRTTGSDSPVRFASSSASPSALITVPSATTWSPAVSRTRSPTTTWSTGTPRVAPVADDHRLRGDQRGEPVERALRADLLERPDPDVRDQDPEEERVLPRPEGDRQDAEQQKDPVRDRQRVRANDARVAAAGVRAGRSAARLQACRRLGFGQARERDLGGSGGDAAGS